MNNLFKGAALFIGGAMVGAAIALLLTPKTGEQIREDLSGLMDEVKKNAHNYCEQAKQAAEQIKQQVQEIKEA